MFQTKSSEHISNGRAGSMDAGHGQTIGLNGSSKSIASTHPMLMRSSTDHFSPSSISMPPPTPMMGPLPAPGGGMRREPFEALLRGDDSLANKVQTVIISRKYKHLFPVFECIYKMNTTIQHYISYHTVSNSLELISLQTICKWFMKQGNGVIMMTM